MTTKPRPSSLPNLEMCPRWVNRPKTAVRNSMDEAADEGTLLHAKCEEISQGPVEGWYDAVQKDPDLAPAQFSVVTEALEQVKDLFQLGLPLFSKRTLRLAADAHYELDCHLGMVRDEPSIVFRGQHPDPIPDGVFLEVGVNPGVTLPGTADLVVKYGNRAWVCDYKFVRVEREHTAQMTAYVVGVFRALREVEFVELRIVAPRLWGAHAPEVFSREKDLARMTAELEAIVARADDPFTPGCPGEPCATCFGNGRCPYQAASLKDIPVDETGLVMPEAWLPVITAATPECRGQRRRLVQWLDKFTEAVKEADKEWALANPDLSLPGFTKSIALGRLSVDKDRLAEANMAFAATYNMTPETMVSFMTIDRDRAAEIVALKSAMSEKDAKSDINKVLAPYMKRGADIVSFRAETRKAAAKKLPAPAR